MTDGGDPFIACLELALAQHGATMCVFAIRADVLMRLTSFVQLSLKTSDFRNSTSPGVEEMRALVAYVANELEGLSPTFTCALKRNWES